MISIENKGRSPFFPDQPAPAELFVGRAKEIDRIMTRAVGQVAAGKPVNVFVEGEYGIGKTSIARFTQWLAERDRKLLGIYATLDRADSMDEVGAAVLEGTLRSGIYSPKSGEKIRNAFAKYLGEQSLFGVTIHAEALKKEGPQITRGLLPFLRQTLSRVKDEGIQGIFLIFDEINGIAANPKFAPFLKGLSDLNAQTAPNNPSLPLLLMLVGTEERRREISSCHPSVAGIFDIVRIERLSDEEMTEFYQRAFESVRLQVEKPALDILTHYAAGFPKIMHIIGNAAYWLDRDGAIDREDAMAAVMTAAEDIGRKYVDHQVYQALRSRDYLAILHKIGKLGPDAMSFSKKDIEKGLTESEKKKLHNFLQKMKTLKVLQSGEIPGEYVFPMRMVRLYLWLQSHNKGEN
ncbi:MAG: AAA family ATPase [Candidatus Sumerlaeota bacterium]|nr:AAA family ATPase [Candidatus Sumerlaeota bacterium]